MVGLVGLYKPHKATYLKVTHSATESFRQERGNSSRSAYARRESGTLTHRLVLSGLTLALGNTRPRFRV